MSEEITIENFLSVYIPAPKHLVKNYGAGAALVWGCILRYSQISDGPGYCYASYATLAEETGLHISSVRRHISVLIMDGYLEEIDPAEPGQNLHRTRKLKTTTKLRIGIKAIQEIEGVQNEHPTLEEGVQSEHPRVSKLNRGVSKLNTDQSSLTNESLTKVLKDDDEDTSSSSLSSSLKKITGVNSKNEGFVTALAALKKAKISTDRLEQWFKDDTGWPEARPPNATRKKPWPSQVADLVPVWKSPHERRFDWLDGD